MIKLGENEEIFVLSFVLMVEYRFMGLIVGLKVVYMGYF